MSQQIARPKPSQNQESVWDYPRPPRVEPSTRRIRVIFNGQVIAETTRAVRVLETSHPPTYYIPPEDIRMEYFTLTQQHTFCEYKGAASYWMVRVSGCASENVAWSYPKPARGYEAIKDHLAFYASRVEACYVDDEQVAAQEGDFYGGWITSEIIGPFKGAPGTWGW